MIKHSIQSIIIFYTSLQISVCLKTYKKTPRKALHVISQSQSTSYSVKSLSIEIRDGTNTQTQQHSSVSSTGALPQSKYWFALRSEPHTADCRCGQRQSGRPCCRWETHRSLHTHQALKETLNTAWKGRKETRLLGLTQSLVTSVACNLSWLDKKKYVISTVKTLKK